MRYGWMLLLVSMALPAQENPAASITTNHAATAADGTVRMQRVMPLPQNLSAEAKAWLSRPAGDAQTPQTLAGAADACSMPPRLGIGMRCW